MDPGIVLALLGGGGLTALVVWYFASRENPPLPPGATARSQEQDRHDRKRQHALEARHKRRDQRRNGTFNDNDDDGTHDPGVSNDFGDGDSVSDRLNRAADRYDNAGDSTRASQARAAADHAASGTDTAAASLAVAEFLEVGSDPGPRADASDSGRGSDGGSFSDNS